jgi:hypothetical protein
MGLSTNKDGPLQNAVLVQYDEVVWWDQTRPKYPIDPRDDDKKYTVKQPDRLDAIAESELGNVQLGWVILERNDLRLIPNDLVPGMTLFIPSIESLKVRGIIK